MNAAFDVVGVGNALVDVLSHVDEDFLGANGVQKGVMQLIGSERAIDLYARMGRSDRACGGSTANSIASLARLGVRTGYIGKIKDDELGRVFAEDFARLGVAYSTPSAPGSAPYGTGRCLVLVTPDGERSMNTYLGAAEFLSWEDFSEDMIASARWIYLEGYRFDGPQGQDAFHRAVRCCRRSGGKAALTLSDPICVSRHRPAFRSLIDEGIDLLFCNRAELMSLYQTGTIDKALSEAAREVDIVACTLSEEGAVVASGDSRAEVPAPPVELVDATGAGDLFAAGFLFGLIHGRELSDCARLGCAAAAEVISHIGARPVSDLGQLFHSLELG